METLNTTAAITTLPTAMMVEYSVSEVSQAIRNLLDDNLRGLRVRGEIMGLKVHPSGHVYFSLKDTNAVLKAVCWRNTALKLPIKLEEGMEVICVGSISSYANGSYYQIIVDKVEVAGIGALLAMLEERKKKLQAEGLFEHKKPLPFLPKTIGIITSPTGAVIHDILHRLQDRFPVHVLVWPVAVQGDGCAEQVAQAINGFNQMTNPPDVLIVARGGGSIEDLWGFNEEIVARAVATSKIPLISAIGHETDTTLIDYASDRRAPTPTAAAEMAVPVYADLKISLQTVNHRLDQSVKNMLAHKHLYLTQYQNKINIMHLFSERFQRLDQAYLRLTQGLKNLYHEKVQKLQRLQTTLHPQFLYNSLQNAEQRCNRADENLKRAIKNILDKKQDIITLTEKILAALSYKKTLERGFALVKGRDNKLIKSVAALKNNDLISIEMHDGSINAVIQPSSSSPKKKRPISGENEEQFKLEL